MIAFDHAAYVHDDTPAKATKKTGKWPVAVRAALMIGSSVALWAGIFALIR